MQSSVHTCKNCNNRFSGKYCNNCGEKVYGEHDKSIAHFFEQGLHFITHLEGTLFTSIKVMVTKPGKLSLDYCNGIRKKYFKPLSLFLLLVIIYLLFPFFEGLNMELKYYPKQNFYGAYAYKKVESKLQATGWSMGELSEKFHIKAEKTSKFLLIIIVPLAALVFYAMTFYKRRYLFDHMVFSAEINSFYLLWGFLLLPLLISIIFFITRLLSINANVYLSDNRIGLLIYIPVVIYTANAAKRFYNFKWRQNMIFCIVFFAAHTFIVYTLYKFLLFVTVINQIH